MEWINSPEAWIALATLTIREIVLDTSGWKEFEFALSSPPFEEFSLIFETSRTWQPAQAHKVPDARHLAIGLGDYWFRYDSKLPWEKSADRCCPSLSIGRQS
jgi:hypothetical protein